VDISDVREEDIPDIGYVFLEDSETGEQMLVDTSDFEFRKRYTALANRRSDDRLSRMKRLNIDMIRMNTSEPFYLPLQQFFKMRDRRRGVVR
jgi:hypothetical protein